MLRTALRATIAVAVATLSATGHARPKQPRDVAGAGAPASRPATPAAVSQERAREIAAMVKKVSALRQLRQRRPVPAGVVSREQILAEINTRLAKEYTAEEIAADSVVLQRLGLLPRGADYKQALLDLLTDQVAGFYDPERRRLNIADWLPWALQAPALVHEICHALQDQHFPLRKLIKPIKDNSDQQLARVALIEGDCTGVMIEHMLAPMGQDLGSLSGMIDRIARQAIAGQQTAAFRAAPAFLRETLVFPYLAGLRFMQYQRRTQSWVQIGRLYARPPASTAEILHPAGLPGGRRLAAIRTATLPALAGHRLLKTDTLGELQLAIWAQRALSREAAERAAEGWRGDRLAAFLAADAPAGALPLVVHLSAWASEADAREHLNAARRVIALDAQTARSELPTRRSDLHVQRDAAGDEWSVEHRAGQVLLILGAPPALRALLQDEVWARWRVDGRTIPAAR